MSTKVIEMPNRNKATVCSNCLGRCYVCDRCGEATDPLEGLLEADVTGTVETDDMIPPGDCSGGKYHRLVVCPECNGDGVR